MNLLESIGIVLTVIANAIAPAAAQGIRGGNLYVAQPGPVTMTLQGYSGPVDNFWTIAPGWSTGPGARDWFVAGLTGPANGMQIIRTGAAIPPLGTVISSLPLAAGTQFYPVTTWNNSSTVNYRELTGITGKDFHVPPPGPTFAMLVSPTAVVFPGLNNTVQVGYLMGGIAPQFGLLDYPLRILVGNVCVK
jgi:hypothetical protein